MDLRISGAENETPPHCQPIKTLSFFNGENHHHQPPPTAVAYGECLKNHAAGIGGHAVDGCGEFMKSPNYTQAEPTSLTCAACGCHRNFHRRRPTATTTKTHFIGFHGVPPPPPPHVLLSLSTAVADQNPTVSTPDTPAAIKTESRKRFRTKFSDDQKEKMCLFAEKVGWKMQRCDDKMVADFCNNIGIRRGIFKVWMHNNKNTFGKREKNSSSPTATAAAAAAVVGVSGSSSSSHGVHLQAFNGSSSSS